MEDYIPIGFTKKTHGLNGALKVAIEAHFLDDLADCSVVFLRIDGRPIPFFIEDIDYKGALLLKLEDVDNPEAAKALSGTEISLRRSEISSNLRAPASAPTSYHTYLGYSLIGSNEQAIGPIKAIEQFPQQVMAIVERKGKEILIPLNDKFILQVDEQQQRITVELPDGLLEL